MQPAPHHNLYRAFGDQSRVRILGYTTHMNELMAAADVIVHSTGGITCLEALVRGCPLVTYGSPPGHASDYCRALAAARLSRHVSTRSNLAIALHESLNEARPAAPSFVGIPTPGQIIGEMLGDAIPPPSAPHPIYRFHAESV